MQEFRVKLSDMSGHTSRIETKDYGIETIVIYHSASKHFKYRVKVHRKPDNLPVGKYFSGLNLVLILLTCVSHSDLLVIK